MLRILLIDDNTTDVLLTQITFEDAALECELSVAGDGVEGLERLRSETLPHLVLLDINMPRMGGLEVLERVKQDPVLSVVPVFMLLSSANEEELWRSRELKADGYVPKPIDPTLVLSLLEGARVRPS